jgi:hypothetical protein
LFCNGLSKTNSSSFFNSIIGISIFGWHFLIIYFKSDSIKALTKSTKDQSNEFVVHVNNEYDYRFDSE